MLTSELETKVHEAEAQQRWIMNETNDFNNSLIYKSKRLDKFYLMTKAKQDRLSLIEKEAEEMIKE